MPEPTRPTARSQRSKAAAKKRPAAKRQRAPRSSGADPVAVAAAAVAPFEPPFAPTCCQPEAFALMHQQAVRGDDGRRGLDSDEGLLLAATAVAMHALPQVEPAEVEGLITQLAQRVRRRVRGDSPRALLAHLHHVLFDELRFTGSGNDYHNPRNSHLPCVLSSRRGLPITLALVYKLVAGQVGLRAWGVGLPGHFVAGVDCDGPMLVDCFAGGRILDRDDARERVAETAGEDVPFTSELLRPVTHRHWMTRLIQNLLQAHAASGQYADVAAMLEFELLLWPDQLHLQRDLGLVLARLGQVRPAATWINRYLEQRPEDPQRGDLEELLAVLK